MGEKISIETENERKRPEKSEVQRLLADSSQACDLLGWKPSWDLEKGLKETIRWFVEKENQTSYKSDIYNI